MIIFLLVNVRENQVQPRMDNPETQSNCAWHRRKTNKTKQKTHSIWEMDIS